MRTAAAAAAGDISSSSSSSMPDSHSIVDDMHGPPVFSIGILITYGDEVSSYSGVFIIIQPTEAACSGNQLD